MTTICLILNVVLISLFGSFVCASELSSDGSLRLYSYHLNEFLEIRYKDANGDWLPEAEKKLNQLLRSRADDQTIKIDRKLIAFIDHLQDHFEADTVEVISGFRSQAFNKQLKDSGRNVANESFHTKGQAMDIHLDEIQEDTLRDYALKQQKGGVGYYGNLLMVHIDTGPVRKWSGGDFKNNTAIGIFNDKHPGTARSDQLFYKSQQILHLQLNGFEQEHSLRLEVFHRGKWLTQRDLKQELGKENTHSFPISVLQEGFKKFGKFRFVLIDKNGAQQSNEFYIKRI
ncbi:MAG: YcbK family protein [Deltaproteobacteria bacterium]|nr:YcbK family protein [Deltaproteobacteria bacterium]